MPESLPVITDKYIIEPDAQPVAKALAATSVSQSLSFCMERKYLQNIEKGEIFSLKVSPSPDELNVEWLSITHIGKPIADSMENCFTATQKILYSCFLPKDIQLLFLIIGDSDGNHIYLGLRSHRVQTNAKSLLRSVDEFVKGVWPGIQTNRVPSGDATIKKFCNRVENGDFYDIRSFTGIPSMESNYKSVYPATVDKLMSGMNGKDYAYLVVADPIDSTETDGMLFQCRDMCGQAESLKTINITEGLSKGTSFQTSVGKSVSTTKGTQKSVQRKDFSKLGKLALSFTGLGVAASVFPAAARVLNGCANTAGAVTGSVVDLLGDAVLGGLVSIMTPQITETELENRTEGVSESTSSGANESRTSSLTRNIVSKHIESVVEHLQHHTERLEHGKATGMWKVGVFLMATNENDVQGGSMQLRSIISGQESIFEPIRIHDVSALMSPNSKSIGNFHLPSIAVNDVNGKLFDHPLGIHYNELKTVLTTKELSYLVNFPIRSVPGISVIEYSSEFSMTPQKNAIEKNLLELGGLVYSGSQSNIKVSLPIDTLSRHALVCGVNGSGKTNTVLGIVESFLNLGRPFFVIEPAKTEYVDWALEYNEKVQDPKKKIKVFVPGCEKYAKANFTPEKLRLNPFEVISLPGGEMRILSHIDRLKSIFAAAFPMQDILPVIMEHLLYDLYTTIDPMLESEAFQKKGFPTLETIDRAFIDNLMTNIGYARENTQNISAALRTRMKSLKYGWKGEMLNNPKLMGDGMSWDTLFGSPVVVNLSYAGDDQDRAFIMSLLLQFLYEYRIAESESGVASFKKNECRHLVVVEEAHRVMSRCDNPELPQYKSGLMFSNFLSEVRAYGQGMMVVDQIPSRLIEDAIKNTNVKIIHKLVASDDAGMLAECIGLTPEQQKIISKLSVGQAVLAGFNSADVMSANSGDIYLAQLNKKK